jgi:hypothetical protein
MRLLSTPLALTLAVASFSLAFIGCVDALPVGTTATNALPTPSASESFVTFVRPASSCDTGEYFIVVDEQGRFAGKSASGTQFSVPVVPGRHVFYAWSNVDFHLDLNPGIRHVAATTVNATAGTNEYVEMEVESPCRGNTVRFAMRAIGPSNAERWGELQKWLGSTQPVTVDRAEGQAELEAHPAHLQRNLEVGHESLGRSTEVRGREDRGEQLGLEDSTGL